MTQQHQVYQRDLQHHWLRQDRLDLPGLLVRLVPELPVFRLHPLAPSAPMDPVVRRHPEHHLRLLVLRVPSDLLALWDLEAQWRQQVQVHRQLPVAREVPQHPEHHLRLMALRVQLHL